MPGGRIPTAGTIPGALFRANGSAVISGGSAGTFACSGIQSGDVIVAVWLAGGPVSTPFTDLTSQFVVASDGTVDNTGGTASTGRQLLVVWTKSGD